MSVATMDREPHYYDDFYNRAVACGGKLVEIIAAENGTCDDWTLKVDGHVLLQWSAPNRYEIEPEP